MQDIPGEYYFIDFESDDKPLRSKGEKSSVFIGDYYAIEKKNKWTSIHTYIHEFVNFDFSYVGVTLPYLGSYTIIRSILNT